jgi:hypothetical protein
MISLATALRQAIAAGLRHRAQERFQTPADHMMQRRLVEYTDPRHRRSSTASPQGGEPPLIRPLATLAVVRPYFVARRCRFTYSQSRFVIPDGGIGALPNTDSSVSVHPLKLTAYPPNGTFFGGLDFPFALVFAIVSSFAVNGGPCRCHASPQGDSEGAGHGGDRPRGQNRPQGT